MMTFADLSFILMCFFALLLSFSKPNKHKFENVIRGMAAKPSYRVQDRNLEDVARDLRQEIKRHKLEHAAAVKLDAEGLAIEFKDRLVFAPGSARAHRQFAGATQKVMDIISKSPEKYQITIEGHTDDMPLVGHRRFNSNWELSAARGITLLRLFQKKGVRKQRMRVVSYADTRPKIDPRRKAGRKLRQARAANRRVVIRLE